MLVEYAKTFLKDIQKITDKKIKNSVEECIVQVKKVDTVLEITHLKKMIGYKNYFRIRIGEYRIGISIKNNTIKFIRILHRKEIYAYFP